MTTLKFLVLTKWKIPLSDQIGNYLPRPSQKYLPIPNWKFLSVTRLKIPLRDHLKIPLSYISGHLKIPLSDQVENSTHWPPENSSQIPFISLNLSYAGSWHLKIWFSKQQYWKNHFLLHFWQLWRVSEIIFIVHFQMSRLVATADFRNYANSTIPKTLEGQNWEPETYPGCDHLWEAYVRSARKLLLLILFT